MGNGLATIELPDEGSTLTTRSTVYPVDLVALACAGLKASSADGYRKDLRAWSGFVGVSDVEASLWGLIRLGQGPANALALSWVDHQLKGKLSPATIRRRIAALVRVISRARRIGLTGLNLEVDLPKAEALRDTAGPGAKGWASIFALIESRAASGQRRAARDRAIVLLLHDRALRRGEVSGLDYPDHFDPSRPAVQVLGKGKSSREWLTINDRTSSAIAEWILTRGDWPGPLFVRADNAAGDPTRLSGEAINRLVVSIGSSAGILRRTRAHGLRHQAITEALDSGYDVRDVRHFSRHAKIDTVLIYDDRRKDLGGEITRSIGGKKSRRRAPGN